MKQADVPAKAYAAPATAIPMKMIYDWDALLKLVETQGFVVIESADLRTTSRGGEECVLVKTFNNYLRTNYNIRIRTRRIGKYRWVCTL